jgi:hypothetical protein
MFRSAIPATSRARISSMRSWERLWVMARRSSSASPGVNPAASTASRIACSWKSGIPRVRSSTGRSGSYG